MNLIYKKISEDEYDKVKKMLLEDKDTSEDLWYAVDFGPEDLTVVYLDNEIVGLIQIEEWKKPASLVVFVSLQHRCKGIGHALLEYAEGILNQANPKEIITEYLSYNENSIKFARKHGYNRYFNSVCMKYDNGKFNKPDIFIRQYCDNDFLQAYQIYSEAFYEMEASVGDFPNIKLNQPSEEERNEWNEDTDNLFVCMNNNEIVGVGKIDESEIDFVAIRTDLQGKGIGKKFVRFLCNEIYDRGEDNVILWCIVGNKAKYLYEALGFVVLYEIENAHKFFV